MLQDAARHAVNRQRREAGDTRRSEAEEAGPDEAEEEVSMAEGAPQACKTRTRHPGNKKRWGHDGFEAVWGGR